MSHQYVSCHSWVGRWAPWILAAVTLSVYIPALQASPPKENDQDTEKKLSKEEKRRQKAIQKEMESPYKKWLSEEVPYIITDDERAAFKKFTTDEEREQFVEQFWERRNPNPGSPENEFKEEYYRRIAYANEHYASGIPGWRTDRGRIYIMWGPPDEIESHPSGGTYDRPADGRRRRDLYFSLREVAVSLHRGHRHERHPGIRRYHHDRRVSPHDGPR